MSLSVVSYFLHTPMNMANFQKVKSHYPPKRHNCIGSIPRTHLDFYHAHLHGRRQLREGRLRGPLQGPAFTPALQSSSPINPGKFVRLVLRVGKLALSCYAFFRIYCPMPCALSGPVVG